MTIPQKWIIACGSMLVYASVACAQSVNVNTTATVVVPLSIVPFGNTVLNFNTADYGSYIPLLRGPNPTTITAYDLDHSAGFKVSGEAGDRMIVQVPESFELRLPPPLNANLITCRIKIGSLWFIRTRSSIYGMSSGNNPSTPIILSTDNGGDALEPGANPSKSHDGHGQAYINIGGTINIDALQHRGMYSGTLHIATAYY